MYVDESGKVYVGTAGGLTVKEGTNWDTYDTVNSGLYANDVYDVFVDKNGVIYAGGYNNGSLSIKNGETWTTYTTNDGLGSGFITVCADGNGNIYAGSTTNGLCIYDGTTWTIYTTDNELGSNNVYGVHVDEKGNIYAATTGGLSVFR